MKKIILLVVWLAVSASVLAEGPAQLDDLAALRELQIIAARKPDYSPELGDRVTELIFHLADHPRFRHQTATLMNLNGGFVDRILNRRYLETFDPATRDLPNFARVDRKLFRGGQPTEQGFKRLKEMGVKTIVNLRAEEPGEKNLVESLGFRYTYLPVPDTNRPTDGQVDEFLKLMKDSSSGRVYVHCAAGINRTGTMVAIRRLSTGMKAEEALAEARKFGFHEDRLAADRSAALIRHFRAR